MFDHIDEKIAGAQFLVTSRFLKHETVCPVQLVLCVRFKYNLGQYHRKGAWLKSFSGLLEKQNGLETTPGSNQMDAWVYMSKLLILQAYLGHTQVHKR